MLLGAKDGITVNSCLTPIPETSEYRRGKKGR